MLGDTYFKVYRSLLEHPLWLCETFSKGQAWIDLIGLAQFADRSIVYNGKQVKIERGQIFVGLGFFEQRWKWSRGKVRRFFDTLQKDGMCKVSGTSNGTTITLEKYDFFQGHLTVNNTTEENMADRKRTKNGTSNGTTKTLEKSKRKPKCEPANGTTDGTSDGTLYKNNKNIYINNSVENEPIKELVDSDGFVYVRGEDGKLECIGRKKNV